MNFSFYKKSSLDQPEENKPAPIMISEDLHTNLESVKKEFGECIDLIIRELDFGIAVVHLGSMTDPKTINDDIIYPLMALGFDPNNHPVEADKVLYKLKNHTLAVSLLTSTTDWYDVIAAVASGRSVILLNQCKEALIAGCDHVDGRSVEESTTQVLIRGPKDSFTELIRTNISLVRNRVRNSSLRVDALKLGKVTQTDVVIMYIEGIVRPDTLKEVKQRLSTIKIDSVLESGYIESFIQDSKFTIFPTILNTDRPDVVTANLLEGRVAILINGTPFALIVPTVFMQFFQSPEDYYQRYDIGSLIRMLRICAFFVSLLVPSLYIAATTHHQGMIPTVLVFSIAAQREGVPFPLIIEVMIMELAFELLREAGIRMPRAVGQAASIVGALILGEAAVQAGFVSASTIIVVSTTAIASFAVPNYNIAITARILRFIMMIMAAYIGLYGILIGLFAVGLHLCKLSSFGVAYLTPIAPFVAEEQKDAVFRFPLTFMFKRPATAKETNLQRLDGDQNET